MMQNVLIIEDEPQAAQRLETLIEGLDSRGNDSGQD